MQSWHSLNPTRGDSSMSGNYLQKINNLTGIVRRERKWGLGIVVAEWQDKMSCMSALEQHGIPFMCAIYRAAFVCYFSQCQISPCRFSHRNVTVFHGWPGESWVSWSTVEEWRWPSQWLERLGNTHWAIIEAEGAQLHVCHCIYIYLT
jgi:hypothetical protein